MNSVYKLYWKPCLDFALALFLLIICLPIFLFLVIILAVHFKKFPFFLQFRNGKDGKEFKVIKFKTMTDEMDKDGQLLSEERRLTSIGKVVRKLSLDEIPQIINVLKWEMSFVGPRPLVRRYYPYFNKHEKKRFLVKPGITGLSQVTGRNQVHWEKRLKLDVEYIEKISFTTDLKIILKTVAKLISTENNDVNPASKMIDFDEYKKQQYENKVR